MGDDIWAIPLQLSDFNIVVALLGGFISLFGLVSYLLKEKYYMSEARKLFSATDSPIGLSTIFLFERQAHDPPQSSRFWSAWLLVHLAQTSSGPRFTENALNQV